MQTARLGGSVKPVAMNGIRLSPHAPITESGVQKTYGFAKYLHDSLPNATYVGFTGTPVDGTIEVFGGVVDAYTMTEAVKDGITVNLVYDGRAAKVMLNQDKVRQIRTCKKAFTKQQSIWKRFSEICS